MQSHLFFSYQKTKLHVLTSASISPQPFCIVTEEVSKTWKMQCPLARQILCSYPNPIQPTLSDVMVGFSSCVCFIRAGCSSWPSYELHICFVVLQTSPATWYSCAICSVFPKHHLFFSISRCLCACTSVCVCTCLCVYVLKTYLREIKPLISNVEAVA